MKYLFYFLVGFGTHKILQTTYSYVFWSTEYSCAYKSKTGGETKVCAEEKLKIPNTIAKYTISYISYTMGHWQLEF